MLIINMCFPNEVATKKRCRVSPAGQPHDSPANTPADGRHTTSLEELWEHWCRRVRERFIKKTNNLKTNVKCSPTPWFFGGFFHVFFFSDSTTGSLKVLVLPAT